MLRLRAIVGRPPLPRPTALASPRRSIHFAHTPVRYQHRPDGHVLEGQPRLAEQGSAPRQPTSGSGAGVAARNRRGRDPATANQLKCWYRIRRLLRQGPHLQVGRNSEGDLSNLSRQIRLRLARFRLGAPSKSGSIKEVESPQPRSNTHWDTQQTSIVQIFRLPDPRDEDTPSLLVCLGIWQADETKYPTTPGPQRRSGAVPSQEDGENNEQYRLFGEFREYLLKLAGQVMEGGSTHMPMKAVVIAACPGHFVTTCIDSSGKREDVIVGWLGDQGNAPSDT